MTQPILMTLGPTFDKIVALALLLQSKGWDFSDIHILFEDQGDKPGSEVLDVDVRTKYQKGSSASENMARSVGRSERLAGLLRELNKNNAEGHLKGGAYMPLSFVHLIRKSYDLKPEGVTVTAWRQQVVGEFLEIAEAAIWFYENSEKNTMVARKAFVAEFPEYDKSPRAPFCLGGYAYTRHLQGHSVTAIAEGCKIWSSRFVKSWDAKEAAVARLQMADIDTFSILGRDILWLSVETDLDAAAAFQAFPSAQIVIAHDCRKTTQIKRTAILTRSGVNLSGFVRMLKEELDVKEPGCWYLQEVAGGSQTPWLLNGSTARAAPGGPSQIGSQAMQIVKLIKETAEKSNAKR